MRERLASRSARREQQMAEAPKDSTLTLTAFLLARIAEDEAVARAALAHENAVLEIKPSWTVVYAWAMLLNRPGGGGSHNFQPGAPSPTRVLAECEAKRRVVEREHVDCAGHPGPWMKHDDYGPGLCARADEQNATLRDLVSIYADHPDYREEWRP